MSEIYMMVTICNRKQMQKFVKFYKQNHVDTGNISLAMGTAASFHHEFPFRSFGRS